MQNKHTNNWYLIVGLSGMLVCCCYCEQWIWSKQSYRKNLNNIDSKIKAFLLKLNLKANNRSNHFFYWFCVLKVKGTCSQWSFFNFKSVGHNIFKYSLAWWNLKTVLLDLSLRYIIDFDFYLRLNIF